MKKSNPWKCSRKRTISIMTAAAMMASAVFAMANIVTAYAGTIPDNPSGNTASIPLGESMDNNWGTITSNEGTLTNNVGTVQDNYGTVVNNWGTVDNDSKDESITTVDTGSNAKVEINHTGGTVTDGLVTDNYGSYGVSGDASPILEDSVTNNYKDGTVVGDARRELSIDNNYGTATDVVAVRDNYGTVINDNIDGGIGVVYNYVDATLTGVFNVEEDNVPVPVDQTGNLTKEDPNPTAPVEPSSKTETDSDQTTVNDDDTNPSDNNKPEGKEDKTEGDEKGKEDKTEGDEKGKEDKTEGDEKKSEGNEVKPEGNDNKPADKDNKPEGNDNTSQDTNTSNPPANNNNPENPTGEGNAPSSSGDPSSSSATVQGVVATPQIIVGGKTYKSTVSGAFITRNISIAVIAPSAEIASKAGIGAGESLYFKGWEFTANQSPLAYQALTGVAGSVGGNVLQCVELNFGKVTFGKFSELSENVVSRATISLPKKADKNKKHALARAAKGGKSQMLENVSEDPNVITADIPGGAAAYAIVEY